MMRGNRLREVEMDLEARRAGNRAEEARRLEEATEKDPEIGRLVQERMELLCRRTASAISQPGEAYRISEALSGEVAALLSALRARLVKAGFPPDYLQPVYQCGACRDTGYVGDLIRDRCACFERLLRQKTLADAGHGLDTGETFERYDSSVYSDLPLGRGKGEGDTQRAFMARVRERCEAYADAFPHTPTRNILMFGKSGLGKTYVMNCMGNRVAERGFEALKITAYQLTERMRASVFDRDPYAFPSLLEVPLLLLDDLGVEPMIPNITLEQLFTLMNERGLRGLHTVVSTNLELDELKVRYTERVFSRLADSRNTLTLNFLGTDVRLRL